MQIKSDFTALADARPRDLVEEDFGWWDKHSKPCCWWHYWLKEQIANTATRSNVLAVWKHDMDFDSDRHLDYIGGKCRHFYR